MALDQAPREVAARLVDGACLVLAAMADWQHLVDDRKMDEEEGVQAYFDDSLPHYWALVEEVAVLMG